MGKIIDPEKLQGKYVNLREVTVDDAEFILELRNSENAKFLHKTDKNLQNQIDYIKNYLELTDEWYFIVEDKNHNPVGTQRILTIDDDVFETASTIMIPEASPMQTIEMIRMTLKYAFGVLGFKKQSLYVDKKNERVIRLNKLLGVRMINEDDDYYYFEATPDDYKWLKK